MSTNNTLENIIAPLTDGLKEKLKDPFLNAFIISATVWNYQVFLYAFSNLSPDTKYALIERSLNIWSILGPALLSIFYNIVFKFVFYWGYKIAARIDTKVKNAQEIEHLAFMTAQAHLNASNDQILSLKDTVSQKDQAIGALRSQLSNKEQENRIERSKLEQRIAELEKMQDVDSILDSIINDLKVHGFTETFERFSSALQNGESPSLTNREFIKYATAMDLIKTRNVGSRYILTTKGKNLYNRIVQLQFEAKASNTNEN